MQHAIGAWEEFDNEKKDSKYRHPLGNFDGDSGVFWAVWLPGFADHSIGIYSMGILQIGATGWL
jgi:hypothetical protein